jgi:hypothetical protein
MKQNLFLFIILLFLILILLRLIKPKILEHAIEFQPPHLTNNKDKDTIGELMRIGTQANSNSVYDTVDTNLLAKPK